MPSYFLLILLITECVLKILDHNESVGENDTGYNYDYWLHRSTTLIIFIQSTASDWQMIYLEKVIFVAVMIEL
jgi:hypothetical protein